MRRAMMMAAGCACAMVVADVASAQWVTFENETSTRLVISNNFPAIDAEEKDTDFGDLDNDGDIDIVVGRKRPFSLVGPRPAMLLMNENGVLTDRTAEFAPEFLTIPTDSRDIIAADFDEDGWLDIVIVNTFDQQPQYYRNLGEQGGVWQGFVNETEERFPVITNDPLQFCAGWEGDVNGDGLLDIYFANYSPTGFGTNWDILFINTGDGFFADETVARMGNLRNSAFGTHVEMADLDDDGDNDIIKTSTLYSVNPWNQLGVFLLFNDGDGFFNWTGETAGTGDPYMFRVADYNNDGAMDIYTVHDGSDSVRMRTAAVPDVNLTYSVFNVGASRTGGFGGNTKQVDIDNDGDLDLGVSPIDVDIANCGGGGDFALLRNPGNGQFMDPFGPADEGIHEEAHDFDFIDLNEDGCWDIFMGLCSGYRVFIQTTEGCGVTGPAADLNGDGFVNGADLAIMLTSWGACANPNSCPADLDGDDFVNGADLAVLLTSWT